MWVAACSWKMEAEADKTCFLGDSKEESEVLDSKEELELCDSKEESYLIIVISFTQAAFSNSKFYTRKLTKNTPKH